MEKKKVIKCLILGEERSSGWGAGFERWNKIYGETDDVNKVQLDIRTGHAQTVDKVLKWLDEEGGVKDQSICDSGCGTGAHQCFLFSRILV